MERKAVLNLMLELFLIIMLSMEFSLPDNAELKVVDVSLYCDEIQMDSSSSVFWAGLEVQLVVIGTKE